MFKNINIKKNKKKIVIFVLIAFVCVGFDLSSKYWANQTLIEKVVDMPSDWSNVRSLSPDGNLYKHHEIVILDPYFTLDYTRNEDIGFSLLTFLDGHVDKDLKKNALKYLQLFAVLLALGYFIHLNFQYHLAFAFIIGGGLGNVIDRFMHGYVTDFVKWTFPFIPLRLFNPWPIFNLADSCVSVGACILFFYLFKEDKEIIPVENVVSDEKDNQT